MVEVVEVQRPRTGLMIWMIFSQLLALGSLLIWLILAVIPILFWDSPRAPGLSVWLFLLALWTYPVIPIGLSIGSWIAFSLRRNRLAATLSGLTFVPPILVLGFMMMSSLVAW